MHGNITAAGVGQNARRSAAGTLVRGGCIAPPGHQRRDVAVLLAAQRAGVHQDIVFHALKRCVVSTSSHGLLPARRAVLYVLHTPAVFCKPVERQRTP